MNVKDAIQNRYSVRAYQDRPVEREKLLAVLEAGRLAPSGGNRQPWRFVVVQDAALRQKLIDACRQQEFIGQAPVVIVAVGLTPERIMTCGVPGDAVDVSIALEHIALAAVEQGLGTCWIGAFEQDKIRQVLSIPATVKVIEVMPLGYPADPPRPKTRKPMDEIVCWDKWAQPV
jgi:nitroreductase